MTVSMQQLEEWLAAKECENLEFKEARTQFEFKKLLRYCAALANEHGGSIVLGVSDSQPRKVVGTRAYRDLEKTKSDLVAKLHIRIDVTELNHSDGRVVVFIVPDRPIGTPISVDGAYWMRAGSSLVPMTADMLKQIFDEAGPDYSAEICPNATINDLDPLAVDEFRNIWHRKSNLASLLDYSNEDLLRSAELIDDQGVTYAALILCGTKKALGKHLGSAETIIEYYSETTTEASSQRLEFREGFFLYYDKLWEFINRHNDMQHYQDGLFILDIPTFNKSTIREAILNAISHRDYRNAGSVFIKQYPDKIEVVSPGGFPEGITPENILDRQRPRNRRLAEAFAKCGLVERAGQGADRMFELSIREGKSLPDFTNTDEWQVSLTLNGQVREPLFVRFLERIGNEIDASFDIHEFLLLDLIYREEPISPILQKRVNRLIELGVIERQGRGRGVKYLLSRRFYEMIGQKGAYTRRKGLDEATNKELLLRHLKNNPSGSALAELRQVLPHLSERRVQLLLQSLRRDGRIVLEGERRWARWKIPKNPKGT